MTKALDLAAWKTRFGREDRPAVRLSDDEDDEDYILPRGLQLQKIYFIYQQPFSTF
jgi:hypothetical protein